MSDPTPSPQRTTISHALAGAVRAAVAKTVHGSSRTPDNATAYWDGYRAAGNEIADLLEDPALLQRYPELARVLRVEEKPARNMLAETAANLTPTEPIGTLQVALMHAWAKADPRSSVSRHPASYVETFRDLAKAAYTHLNLGWVEVDRGGTGK